MLLAQLDRANWQEGTDEQGRACLEFVAPSDLAAESGEVREEMAERQFWTSMPIQCRQVIDGEMDCRQSAWRTRGTKISEFIDGSLAPTVPPWAVLAVPPGRRNRLDRGIDEPYLHAAHAWIPSLRDARSL
jgi:hypothetical protein